MLTFTCLMAAAICKASNYETPVRNVNSSIASQVMSRRLSPDSGFWAETGTTPDGAANFPLRDWIDAATPDNPVWIQRLDGHIALANSLALEKAGLDDSVVAPEGGAIERDGSNRITGILRDNAMALVGRVKPRPTTKQLLAELQTATRYLHANGVTCVGHMGSLAELQVLRTARATGRLQLRVHAATPLPDWRLLVDDIEKNGRDDDWIVAGGLKGFVDGSLGSHTAAMLEPFLDCAGRPRPAGQCT